MKFCILKSRVRDFLALKLAESVVEAKKDDLIKVLRFNSLGGFEILDDEDLIENLIVYIYEFEMLDLLDSDKEKLVFRVKEQFMSKESDIIKKINTFLKIILFN